MIPLKVDSTRFYKISKSVFVFSLFAILISIVTGVIDHQLFFNTDALYLPTIYKGLFEDGFAFASWQFPDAPFFFPDFFLYIIFHFITKNYFVANLLTAFSIYVLIVLALQKIFYNLIPNKELHRKSLILAGLSIFNLLIAGGYLFIHTVLLISPVFHAGELLGALLLLLLVMEIIKKDRMWLYVAALVITAATTFSDRSLIKDFTVPFFMTFGVLFFIDQKISDKLWKFVLTLLIGTITGSIFYKALIPHTKDLPGIVSFAGQNLRSLLTDFGSFFSANSLQINVASENIQFINLMYLFSIVVLISYVLLGKYLFTYFSQRAKGKKTNTQKDLGFLLGIFILSQSAMNLTATILFGYYRSLIHIRYFTPALVMPLIWSFFSLGLYFASKKTLPRLNRIFVALFGLVIFLTISLAVSIFQNRGSNYFTYKPPNSECIDQLAKERGFTHGLSDLWNSATNTLFSEEGVQVVQIDTLGPYIESNHWLNSTQRILQKSASDTSFPEYSFIMTTKIGEQNIINSLGEPNERIECPESGVLIYDHEEIRPVLEGNFSSKYFFERLKKPGDTEEILGKDFNTDMFDFHGRMQLTESEVEEDHLIKTPDELPGFFTHGPYVTLKRGRYNLTLYYRTENTDSAYVEFSHIPPKVIEPVPLENTSGELQTLSRRVDLGLNTPKIEQNTYNVGVLKLAAFHTGEGKVVLEKLVIERVL